MHCGACKPDQPASIYYIPGWMQLGVGLVCSFLIIGKCLSKLHTIRLVTSVMLYCEFAMVCQISSVQACSLLTHTCIARLRVLNRTTLHLHVLASSDIHF